MKKIILVFTLILSFNVANSQTAKKKSTPKSVRYSEEKALELIADYYKFYNADEEYYDPIVRQISNNVFYVKVQYCIAGKETCYEHEAIDITLDDGTELRFQERNESFWHSKVLVLKIQSSTKYTVTEKEVY